MAADEVDLEAIAVASVRADSARNITGHTYDRGNTGRKA